MKSTILAVICLLSGCSSLNFAGNSSYTVKPFVSNAATGAVVCCEVTIADGKERASLVLDVTKTGDNYTVHLDEKGVTAFQGQAIARDSITPIGAAIAPLITPQVQK